MKDAIFRRPMCTKDKKTPISTPTIKQHFQASLMRNRTVSWMTVLVISDLVDEHFDRKITTAILKDGLDGH